MINSNIFTKCLNPSSDRKASIGLVSRGQTNYAPAAYNWSLTNPGCGRLYISQTCANMLSTYDLACKVPLLVLMLVCVRAGFCFKLGWVREPELEFVLADLNVVVI